MNIAQMLAYGQTIKTVIVQSRSARLADCNMEKQAIAYEKFRSKMKGHALKAHEIAERLNMTYPSMDKTLQKLVKRGHVSKKPIIKPGQHNDRFIYEWIGE